MVQVHIHSILGCFTIVHQPPKLLLATTFRKFITVVHFTLVWRLCPSTSTWGWVSWKPHQPSTSWDVKLQKGEIHLKKRSRRFMGIQQNLEHRHVLASIRKIAVASVTSTCKQLLPSVVCKWTATSNSSWASRTVVSGITSKTVTLPLIWCTAIFMGVDVAIRSKGVMWFTGLQLILSTRLHLKNKESNHDSDLNRYHLWWLASVWIKSGILYLHFKDSKSHNSLASPKVRMCHLSLHLESSELKWKNYVTNRSHSNLQCLHVFDI